MATFTTKNGTIEIEKENVKSYYGTDYFPDGSTQKNSTVIYMKDGTEHNVKESFHEVDAVFDL